MQMSMSEYLSQEMECEGVLACIHGLKQLDREVFQVVAGSSEALTVDEIAEQVNRERSTAYRAVQRLVQSGLLQKEQVNYDQGGYYHVFYPTDPDEIADEMQVMLNDWHAKLNRLIGDFREKYDKQVQQQKIKEK
jgi:predicted transcriptional regulator